MNSPLANTMPTPPKRTANLSQQPTNLSQQPTPTNSVNQAAHADNSPGGQSSRQSNDTNELAEQFDAANSEGQTTQGEPDDESVPRKQYVFASICFCIQYIQLLLLL